MAACLVLFLASCHSATPARPSAGVTTPASDPLVLAEFGTGLPRAGQWRNGFDVADLDGDGNPDIVFGPPRKGMQGPAVFLGDGHGGFHRWKELDLPALPFDYGDAAVADFDGDTRPDLAFAVHLRGLIALHNEGGGRFSERGTGLPFSRPGSGFSSRAIEVADWDGDGRPDLVAAEEGPGRFGPGVTTVRGASLGVFLNRQDHWEALAPQQPDPAFGDGLAVADVDGDGRPDAITSTGGVDGRSILHLNTGSGWRDVAVGELPARASVGAVAAGDVDRDGKADLAVGYLDPEGGTWHAELDLLLTREGGFERRELLREAVRSQFRAIVIADVDGDRHAEVVTLRADGRLHAIPTSATRPATVVSAPDWRRGCSGFGLRVSDLDGDGRPEVVASFAGETSVWEADGGCTAGGGIQAWSIVRQDR